MIEQIYERLDTIEQVYYGGATFAGLGEQIVETVGLIACLDKNDPVRDATDVFAALLWGGRPGPLVQRTSVEAALAGPDDASYLTSWSGIGRGPMANRVAA